MACHTSPLKKQRKNRKCHYSALVPSHLEFRFRDGMGLRLYNAQVVHSTTCLSTDECYVNGLFSVSKVVTADDENKCIYVFMVVQMISMGTVI